jgi:taurine dioxygenase
MPEISVQPVGYALGAQVTGVDLSRPLSKEQVAAIQAAWVKHLVLVFPGQKLDPESLMAFSRNFGQLDNYESQPFNRHPEHDEVFLLSNKPVNGRVPPGASGGQNWHTDLSYTLRPAKGTMVYCIERPSVGGDTMFANMYQAYETLSPVLRDFLDGLEGVHDVNLITAKRAPEIVAEFARLNPPVVHPAVRLHPESGRKALYVNARVRKFVGMTEAESAPIIKFLCDHSVSPRYVYRHRWTVQDLVIWDNRCLTHLAVGDYDPTEIRHMIRTSCMGEYYGRLEDPAAAAPAKQRTSEDLAVSISSMHD